MDIINLPKNKTERRIRRTMVALLNEKPLAEIRVQDICLSLEIVRPTFYRHYDNKKAVITELTWDFLQEFDLVIQPLRQQDKQAFIREINAGRHPHIVKLYAFFRDNQFLLNALLSPGCETELMNGLTERLNEVKTNPYTSYQKKYIARPISFQLFINSLLSVFVMWTENGMVESDKEMAAITTRLWKNSLSPHITVD